MGNTIVTKEIILDCLSAYKLEYQEKYWVVGLGLFGSYGRDEISHMGIRIVNVNG